MPCENLNELLNKINMNVLANDGLSPSAVAKLESSGFRVSTTHVPQAELIAHINANQIAALCVRSATTVRKDLVDACPGLKIVVRGGVGMDNIDVAYAMEKGIKVANTPASSSQSVAELVMAHLFSLARLTFDSNRQMPAKGYTDFGVLKKQYGNGFELRGKTLGIIGFGRIGQSVAKYALGNGMKVVCCDVFDVKTRVSFEVEGYGEISVDVEKLSFEMLLRQSDAISIHVPKQRDGSAVLGQAELAMMKKGSVIVNAARGGVIDESALVAALDAGHIYAAALDVFENEPKPAEFILKHPKIALTPHIGAATDEAQDRIGEELADIIIAELALVK